MSHWVIFPERTEVLKMESGMLMFTIVKDRKKKERQQARKREDYIHCPSGVMN